MFALGIRISISDLNTYSRLYYNSLFLQTLFVINETNSIVLTLIFLSCSLFQFFSRSKLTSKIWSQLQLAVWASCFKNYSQPATFLVYYFRSFCIDFVCTGAVCLDITIFFGYVQQQTWKKSSNEKNKRKQIESNLT
jgi:hypothetical protein